MADHKKISGGQFISRTEQVVKFQDHVTSTVYLGLLPTTFFRYYKSKKGNIPVYTPAQYNASE